MIRVVSKSEKKAQIIVSNPVTKLHQTLHLLIESGTWRDRWGTPYRLNGDDVDWFLFYRDRLLNAIKGKFTPDDVYVLAKSLGHYIDGKEPEPIEVKTELPEEVVSGVS